MPSSIQFASSSSPKPRSSSIYSRPQKKQKMSITQTYFLAHTARGKLSKEAGRADHDLRLLVGHANLLDCLMLDLASAEQEQEQWFTKSIPEEAVEEADADWQVADAEDSDSESDSDYVEEEEEEELKPENKQSATVAITTLDEEDDEEEDYGDLALTRTASRHEAPPELSSDSESESEDEHMPPSPPTATFDAFTQHQRKVIAHSPKDSTLSETQQEAFIEEGFFLPSRPQQQPQQPTMIAAF